VLHRLAQSLQAVSNYPATRGLPELRAVIAAWLQRRFGLAAVDSETQVLPVNGTREALFSFAQAVLNEPPAGAVVCPNPFYQIYEGAALLAGCRPLFLNCPPQNGFLPDFGRVSDDQWDACQLLYICSPGNPSGAVLPLEILRTLVALARRHDFVIASDECYSEIYQDEDRPPPGLLQACVAEGNDSFENCVVFHSLSKRSNLPGLRSGFVAGDARVLAAYFQYRTYHGCAMPVHHQLASIAAWEDEQHVIANRALYRRKFDAVLDTLGAALPVQRPQAGFYLWPRTPGPDTDFARALHRAENVTVLPGRYLGRTRDGANPGANRVRMALVATEADCVEAARRIVRFVQAQGGAMAREGADA